MTWGVSWGGPLRVDIVGPQRYVMKRALTVWSERLARSFTIPGGFEFDGDSVPRIPFVYAKFKGRAHRESALHDWLYYSGVVTRKEADLVFLDAMRTEGLAAKYRCPIYWAVRAFGWRGWNAYRKSDKKQRDTP